MNIEILSLLRLRVHAGMTLEGDETNRKILRSITLRRFY